MKNFCLLILLVAFGSKALCQSTSLLYTVDAQNNDNQPAVQVNGIEFSFKHKDYRKFLWKKQADDSGFQWVTGSINVSIMTVEERNGGQISYTAWEVFYWYCGETSMPLEEGKVFTKNYGGKVVQFMVEKIAYFTGYNHIGNEFVECTLPKFVTFRLMVN
jgi:hypothetical protein